MAQAFLLQDWTTVNFAVGGDVAMNESEWLDLSGFTDVVFYLSVKAVSGTLTMNYETSPSKDNDLFAAMATRSVTVTNRVTDIVRFAAATEPLSRWLRWRLTASAGTPSVTFRIWVAAVATA